MRSRLATKVLTLLLLVTGWACAQSDPEAHAHMWTLFNSYQSAQQSYDYSAYQQAVLSNPNITKRAFISTLEYAVTQAETNPEVGMTAFMFANTLAESIDEAFGDSTPKLIMQQLQQGSPNLESTLTAYVTTLAGGGPPTNTGGPPTMTGGNSSVASNSAKKTPDEYIYYGDNKEKLSDLPPQLADLVKPFFTKLSRITLAMAFRHHSMTMQEIDSYPIVADAFKKKVVALGGNLDGEGGDMLRQMEATMTLAGLVTAAEMGLLQEFDEGVQPILAKDPQPNNHLSLYLMGFRVAYRQQQIAEAQRYMDKLHATERKGGDMAPVLLYGLRTAEYQLAKLKGNAGDPGAAFDRAWAELSSYQPLTKMAHDIPWDYGSLATRFWVDELVAAGGPAEQKLAVVAASLAQWMSAEDQFTALDAYAPEDMILHAEEVQGSFSYLFGMIDQLLYLLERSDWVRAQSNLSVQDLRNIPASLQEALNAPQKLGLTMTGPGFDPIDLSTGNILNELEARVQLIEAQISRASVKERALLLQTSVQSVQKTLNPPVIVDHLLSVGRAYRDMGQSELAILTWKAALQVCEQLNFVGKSIEASSLLAKEYGKQKNWTEAAKHADKTTIKIQQSVPMMGNNDQAINEANQQSQEMAQITAKAAIASNDPKKALAALTQGQQMKAASVQLGAKKPPEIALVNAEEQKVNNLTQKLSMLKAMPASSTRDKMLEKTQKLLADTKSQFLLKSREIRRKYSGLYTTALKFDPLNLPDVQAALPPEAAVIQYFPTEDGTYIFLVTRDQFRLRTVSTTKDQLEKRVLGFIRQVRRRRDNDAGLTKDSQDLYQTLVNPVADDIKDKEILVFIPAGRLNLLPFSALQDQAGVPLIDQKMVLALAKPTDFMRIANTQVKPVKSVVAFANATKDLPAAAVEGENIVKIFPEAKLFKGDEASKKNFFAFGGKAEVLHLATHGNSDNHNSLNNYLAMAGREKVAQNEIFELGLEGTSIVTLSACDTAVSDRTDLSYVASLAEAFWLAGSRSVVASLWAVNDESTSVLMSEFYKQLRAGKSKANALRMAQNSVRANPKFAHPYYWAAFTLFGDWR